MGLVEAENKQTLLPKMLLNKLVHHLNVFVNLH